MNRLPLRRTLACALFVGLISTTVGRSQNPYCPPAYTPPHCPEGMPSYPHSQYPHIPIHPIPGEPIPVEPKEKHPDDLPGGKEEQPDPMVDPGQQNVPPVEQPQVDTTALDAPPAAPDVSGLGLDNLVASSAGMQGRGDSNNRFNLFDNMSAIPRSQVWFGFQRMEQFDTNISLADTFTFGDQIQNRNQRGVNLYRFGVEYAFTERFSVAAQAQYVASTNTDFAADAWANPQFLAKYAFVNCPGNVISATFGIAPQVAANDGELHEITTRLFPGVLFYRELSPNVFLQGGAQLGISTNNSLANTADFALSLGYWLYRAPELQPGYCGCERNRFLRGVIPQVEILGKYVFSNAGSVPFADAGLFVDAVDSNDQGFVIAYEDRNVYDITVGGRFLLFGGLSVGVGYSFPITGPSVRNREFLTTINWAF